MDECAEHLKGVYGIELESWRVGPELAIREQSTEDARVELSLLMLWLPPQSSIDPSWQTAGYLMRNRDLVWWSRRSNTN
jgi:hypothetical protein